ncbi:MAG: hypothetical protein HKN19_01980 [Halioglobus sp.]|nr:hypothetical protein [Halioglobus sp.]
MIVARATRATLLIILGLALLQACTHPLQITGEGDLSATGNGADCALEDAPCNHLVVNAYNTTYTATARSGYGFLYWSNCQFETGNQCSFSIGAQPVQQWWGRTAPPLIAHFSPEVPLGQLSGDFETSLDCEGHAAPPTPENTLLFRSSTTVQGEQQQQCVGNVIFTDTDTGANFLVWLDILHIVDGQPVSDSVQGSYPIREIYGNFGAPFIEGRTYNLAGYSLLTGPLSIRITWQDLDASFGELTQCRVLEIQTPIGTETRRKTYCPRPDSAYEIVENVPVLAL